MPFPFAPELDWVRVETFIEIAFSSIEIAASSRRHAQIVENARPCGSVIDGDLQPLGPCLLSQLRLTPENMNHPKRVQRVRKLRLGWNRTADFYRPGCPLQP